MKSQLLLDGPINKINKYGEFDYFYSVRLNDYTFYDRSYTIFTLIRNLSALI